MLRSPDKLQLVLITGKFDIFANAVGEWGNGKNHECVAELRVIFEVLTSENNF
jgi:hypothetical protein